MTLLSGDPSRAVILGGVLLGLLLARRVLGPLLRLGVRSLVGLGFLALWARSGLAVGLALGVNAFNALVLGVLGVPGLGLLLALRWLGMGT